MASAAVAQGEGGAAEEEAAFRRQLAALPLRKRKLSAVNSSGALPLPVLKTEGTAAVWLPRAAPTAAGARGRGGRGAEGGGGGGGGRGQPVRKPSQKLQAAAEAAAAQEEDEEDLEPAAAMDASSEEPAAGGSSGWPRAAAAGAPGRRPAAMHPMALLPGEEPLELELYFGEGRTMRADCRMGPPPKGTGQGRKLPLAQRYDAAVQWARARMAQRARDQSKDAWVEQLLGRCKAFERKCLAGEAASPADAQQACEQYEELLRELYGPLVLRSHTLSAAALEETGEEDEELQHLRLMQRRFLIWLPPDPPAARDSPVADVPRATTRSAAAAAAQPKQEQQEEEEEEEEEEQLGVGGQGPAAGGGDGPVPGGAGAAAAGSGVPQGGRWDAGLRQIWGEFMRRLEGRKYGDANLTACPGAGATCSLNDTVWKGGRLKRQGVKQERSMVQQISKAGAGQREGRLYVTDGSMPGYEEQAYPREAPGMPCLVDAMSSTLLPHAVRSCRATNLFHALKSESTGTKTFTLFGPAGGGPNLTAFHWETKRRRSYNLGAGDMIVQPLATAANIRKLMRVHAAATGRHSRHGQLLPLEVYLESGVQLVLHVRSAPYATLCELCEQSMHAFVSFADVGCSPPAIKVSCNDFDLRELDSAYWLEKLGGVYGARRLLPEEGPPPDGADTWVQSAYLRAEPRTLAARRAGWVRPWLCEQKDFDLSSMPEVEDTALSSSMEVIAVRAAEKLLDVAAGTLAPGTVEAWAGEVPSTAQAGAALQRLRAVLLDMRRGAAPEVAEIGSSSSEGGALGPTSGGSSEGEQPAVAQHYLGGASVPSTSDDAAGCHFSREYLDELLREVDAALKEGPRDAGWPEQQQQQQGGEGGWALPPAAAAPLLVSPRLHEAYAQALHAERPRLAAAALEGLSTQQLLELPSAALRSHWLLRLQLEWEAAAARPLDLQLLAQRRRQRSALEGLFNSHCERLAAERGQAWGCLL